MSLETTEALVAGLQRLHLGAAQPRHRRPLRPRREPTSCASTPTPRRRCCRTCPRRSRALATRRSTSIPTPPTPSSPRRPPPTSAPAPTRSSSAAAPTRCSTSSPRRSWRRATARSCRCPPTRCTRCSPQQRGAHARGRAATRPRGRLSRSTWRPCSRRSPDAAVVWLCAPNNPTGSPESGADIEALLRGRRGAARRRPRRRRRRGLHRVPPRLAGGPARALSRRSSWCARMSKAFALTGLRVGYAVAARADHRAARAAAPARQRQHGLGQGRRGRPAPARGRRRQRRSARSPSASGLPRAWRSWAWRRCPSVTNFLLCRIGSPAEADAANEALLRGGIVVRTFGPDSPAARAPALHGPRPRSRTNGSSRSSGPGRMGGQHERDHDAASASARRRETRIAVSVDLDGSGEAAIATGVGFYDHLLSSLAHHSLIDIEINAVGDVEVDDHHTVEDVALALGGAISDALGDRAGITRFGAARVPMDESLAQCALDLSGRPFAVIDLPFRARPHGRALDPDGRARAHLVRPGQRRDAAPRRRGSQRPPHGRGRLQGAGPRAAHGRCARPAPRRRRLHQGLAATVGGGWRVTEPIRVAVVDYGAGNLVSIRNALGLLGADGARGRRRPRSSRTRRSSSCPASAPASRPWAACVARAWSGPSSSVSGRAPGSWASASGLQLLFERSHEDGAQMLGLLKGDVEIIADAPSLPHIGWNRLEIQRPHPVLEGLSDGTPAYFVHSYVPVPADPAIVVAETEHGGRFASLVAQRSHPRLPVPSRALRRRRPAHAAQHARAHRRRPTRPPSEVSA